MNGIKIIRNPAGMLREQRKIKCFPVINRGKLWYDSLTDEQLLELKTWYKEWLDAPETLRYPITPKWINDKVSEEEILL